MRPAYPPMRLSPSSSPAGTRRAFAAALFLFGTLNNIIYVVILSAALDLVDKASTPKGLILLANIAPALLVKLGWPYFVPGPTRYARRIAACTALSFGGILVVATGGTLAPRLGGIALASLSSGLGEMTFLQLATVYGALSTEAGRGVTGTDDLGGVAVGWFASGTGAAGVAGAGLWWVVRGLGVRRGLGVCAVLPLAMAATFFLLLPPLAALTPAPPFARATSAATYAPLSTGEAAGEDSSDDGEADEDDLPDEALLERADALLPHLTTSEKLALARPLVKKYMLPLFFVYLAEYTINSGVAPTLLYEVPTRDSAPVLALVIHSLRDYYPLWALLYQTFVFISRSSLAILRLPPLPLALLPLPTLLQLVILLLTALEARTGFLVALAGEHGATWAVAALVCAEGLCGGAAYVNAFHRLATEFDDDENEEDEVHGAPRGALGKDRARADQEREFSIAAVGFSDSTGVLLAALVSTVLEPYLCGAQVARGRLYCREL
ncbi:hypothetical protein JCM3770_003680 [Rhodotorula araucariae]